MRVPVVLVAALAASGGVAHAAEPTFVNGLAQNVFSTNQADWIRGEGWVQSTFDSDFDGKPDRIHFDITRPKETGEGLKVPTIMEASPYYANLGPNSNWSVDVEIGRSSRTSPRATRARRSRTRSRTRGCRGGSRSSTPRTPAPATPMAAPPTAPRMRTTP